MAGQLVWRLRFNTAGLSDRESAMIGAIAGAYHAMQINQAIALGGGREPNPGALREAAESAAEHMRAFFPDLSFRAERGVDPGP